MVLLEEEEEEEESTAGQLSDQRHLTTCRTPLRILPILVPDRIPRLCLFRLELAGLGNNMCVMAWCS